VKTLTTTRPRRSDLRLSPQPEAHDYARSAHHLKVYESSTGDFLSVILHDAENYVGGLRLTRPQAQELADFLAEWLA
jgi:hypothetical protein